MSKKDYQLIADAIAYSYKNCSPQGQLGVAVVAEELATTLKETNPLFDRRRFLVACGLEVAA